MVERFPRKYCKKMKPALIFFVMILLSISIYAQPSVFYSDADSLLLNPEEDFSLIRESPITIDLNFEEEEEEEEVEPKKPKRNFFFNRKTKKGFTRSGFGDNIVIETFNLLKEYEQPNSYVPQVYWYDKERKQIRTTGTPPAKSRVILHGPYKKMVGGKVVEEGMYYVGTKHGRWMTYDKNDILISKDYYHKGWQKESLVRYYDEKFTVLKEVIPVKYGKKDGTYFYFHENGEVAIRGEYKNNSKTGSWVEFYPFRNRRKKEIQYPLSPYDKKTAPYTSKEWDRRGTAVYDAP